MKKTDNWIGVKEITPLNFVRMGLARAKSTTLIEGIMEEQLGNVQRCRNETTVRQGDGSSPEATPTR